MKVSHYSTYGLNSILRRTTLEAQQNLAGAQKELSTGKHEDVGLKLGGASGSLRLLENHARQINQIKQTNSLAAGRMTVMQDALSFVIDIGSANNNAITAEIGGTLDRTLLEEVSRNTLDAITSALNVNIKGEFVFSGINSDSPSVVDYEGASGTAAKAAVENAFASFFGFSSDDPAAAGIDRSTLDAFIDGPFLTLFGDSSWQSLWSPASEDGMRAKISLREIATIPSTAFAQPYRDVIASSVLTLEFAASGLSRDALDHLATRAVEIGAKGMAGLAAEQGKVGSLEERVDQATQRLGLQQNVIESEVSQMTSVDAYETATRINALIIGLEASYAATARIQSLSILNYL